jgi:arginase
MTRFLVVPQWQGSSSARAMQLVDGAEAIAGDLPRSSTTRIEVPLEAGESLGTGVRRFASLQRVAERQADAATAASAGEHVLTVGGDAGVAVTAALGAAGADPGAVVVWFSAHADLHDPETSPTGAFDTMAVRALVDAAIPAATGSRLDPSRLVLAGVRDLDPGEEALLAGLGAAVVPADGLARVAEVVAGLAPSRVFVHVDLDVLDPAEIAGVADAVPFGPTTGELAAAIRAVRDTAPLAGSALTEFSPASPDAAVEDLGTILRLVGVLA